MARLTSDDQWLGLKLSTIGFRRVHSDGCFSLLACTVRSNQSKDNFLFQARQPVQRQLKKHQIYFEAHKVLVALELVVKTNTRGHSLNVKLVLSAHNPILCGYWHSLSSVGYHDPYGDFIY